MERSFEAYKGQRLLMFGVDLHFSEVPIQSKLVNYFVESNQWPALIRSLSLP